MFSNTKLPPVPSKGALRVLTQLAYISSGTAVGLCVLCVQEQRRRIQVLQRLADNARILRGLQKRSISGAAHVAVADAGDANVEAVVNGGEPWHRNIVNWGKDDAGCKSEILPSVVREEYAEISIKAERNAQERQRRCKATPRSSNAAPENTNVESRQRRGDSEADVDDSAERCHQGQVDRRTKQSRSWWKVLISPLVDIRREAQKGQGFRPSNRELAIHFIPRNHEAEETRLQGDSAICKQVTRRVMYLPKSPSASSLAVGTDVHRPRSKAFDSATPPQPIGILDHSLVGGAGRPMQAEAAQPRDRHVKLRCISNGSSTRTAGVSTVTTENDVRPCRDQESGAKGSFDLFRPIHETSPVMAESSLAEHSRQARVDSGGVNTGAPNGRMRGDNPSSLSHSVPLWSCPTDVENQSARDQSSFPSLASTSVPTSLDETQLSESSNVPRKFNLQVSSDNLGDVPFVPLNSSCQTLSETPDTPCFYSSNLGKTMAGSTKTPRFADDVRPSTPGIGDGVETTEIPRIDAQAEDLSLDMSLTAHDEPTRTKENGTDLRPPTESDHHTQFMPFYELEEQFRLKKIANAFYRNAAKPRRNATRRAIENFFKHHLARESKTIADVKDCGARADELFCRAVSEGRFDMCITILQWKKMLGLAILPSQYESLLKACPGEDYDETLQRVFSGQVTLLDRRRLDCGLLNDECRARLATACSTSDWLFPEFDRLYRSLPTTSRSRLDLRTIPAMLMSTWRSTGNVDHVQSKFERARQSLEGFSTKQRILRRAEITMLEIYIDSSRFKEATQLVERLRANHEQDPDCLVLAAVLVSKQRSWAALDRILEAVDGQSAVLATDTARRQFNTIIQLYAEDHTAFESWTFVTDAVKKLHYTPTVLTSIILLKAFVSEGNTKLITKWLEFLQNYGIKPQLTGKVAAEMMYQYYLDMRPPHAFMIHLCDRLTNGINVIHPRDLSNLIKESWSYDMRKAKHYQKDKHLTVRNIYRQSRYLRGQRVKITGPAFNRTHQDTSRSLKLSEARDVDGESLHPTNASELDLNHDETSSVHLTAASKVGTDTATGVGNGSRGNYADASTVANPVAGPQLTVERLSGRNLERTMNLTYCADNHAGVLSMYESSRDAIGLPASRWVFDTAVSASVRLHKGDTTHAERLILQAQDAGMDVRSGKARIALYRLENVRMVDRESAGRLLEHVTDYYRECQRDGVQLDARVAHRAASVLIESRCAHHALRVLDALYHDEGTIPRTLNTVALAVYLKAYMQLGAFAGVQWVVETVLQRQMLITDDLLEVLRLAIDMGQRYEPEVTRAVGRGWSAVDEISLQQWYAHCVDKRRQQEVETFRFGKHLVYTMIDWHRRHQHLDAPLRAAPDHQESIALQNHTLDNQIAHIF